MVHASIHPCKLPRRNHSDRDMVIDGLTHHFAHPTAHTGFLHHGKMQRRKVHRQSIRRALRHTGMAALPGRAESMRNRRDSHSDVIDPLDREERFRPTGGNARKVLTYQAWRLIDEEYGCPVLRMGRDRARWTGCDTIIALRTPFKKEVLVHSTRGTQPIITNRRWRYLRWRAFRLFDELLRRSHGRDNGIL